MHPDGFLARYYWLLLAESQSWSGSWWKRMPSYIAATKSGTMTAAFSCRSRVIRAAIPVYIDAARNAFTRTPSLALLKA